MSETQKLFGVAVVFNGGAGKEHQFATVKRNHGGNTVDLLVWEDENSAWTVKTSVPLRDPKDYGPEGGGYTWHFHA